MSEPKILSYTPQWAPHVTGTFPEKVIDEDGQHEPQLVRMSCSICNATHQVTCTSGATRQHIQTFAVVHAHRDPMRG